MNRLKPRGVTVANKWIVLATVFLTAVGVAAEKKASKNVKAVQGKVAKAAATAAPANVEMSAPAAVAPVTAETAPVANPAPATTAATVAVPSEAKLMGSFEVRPSWTSRIGELHTENEAMLGYKFTNNYLVRYYQYFNTNLYNPGALPDSVNSTVFDGFVRANANNVLTDGTNSLHLEERIYTPVSQGSRDAGMITKFRTYFKYSHQFSNALTVWLMEVPIVPVFSRGDTAGVPNPAFENRVYLMPSISFSDSLSLDLPVWISNVRTRGVAGASGAWASTTMWVYPELTYMVNPNLAIGAAFTNNDSLINNPNGFRSALETGITQLIVRASL